MSSARFKLVLGILAAAAGACLPGVAAAQTPGQDSATGTFTAGGVTFTLDAHSGPSGEDPGGTFVAPVGTFSVACLHVSGSTAVIGVNGPFSSLLEVVDGPVDTFNFSFPPGPLGQDSCSAAPPGIPPLTVTSGNIVVVDAQPLPTSKEQCKSGGWQNFGDAFKNQGQCVAFVERGPKP
jgi:hypothetical protein